MNKTTDVFLSAGTPTNPTQETFLSALESRLRNEGIHSHTLGRNTFSNDAPLKAIVKRMDECSGVVILALERSYFSSGLDKRNGPNQRELGQTAISTSWNQIEAALAYAKNLPMLVLVEEGIRSDGLLEPGHDWYVQYIKPDPSFFNTQEFVGALNSWKEQLRPLPAKARGTEVDLSTLTLVAMMKALTTSQAWAILAGLGTVLAATFLLGTKLG